MEVFDEYKLKVFEDVCRHADDLWASVRKGKLNASAVENLMRSYIDDHKGVYPEWREAALRKAMSLG